jgi:50S ribosomal subunit-associated GTPase HflX
MDRWLEAIKKADSALSIVVGINKTDLVADLSTLDSIRASLSSKFSDVFFCSAQRGDGIEELFCAAAEKCLDSRRPVLPANTEPTDNVPPANTGGCC